MAITIHTDTLQDLAGEEVGGVLTRLTRSYQVSSDNDSDLTSSVEAVNDVLRLSALAAPGSVLGSTWPLDHLYLTRTIVRMRDKRHAQLQLTYRYLHSDIQTLTVIRPFTATRQVSTFRSSIGSQFPVTFNNQIQVPSWTALDVDLGWSMDVRVFDDNPVFFAFKWANQINNSAWQGYSKEEVLCRIGSITPLDARPQEISASSTRSWVFEFQFMVRPGGWQPRVQWIDPATGRPPDNLVENIGKRTVSWYTPRDFNGFP